MSCRSARARRRRRHRRDRVEDKQARFASPARSFGPTRRTGSHARTVARCKQEPALVRERAEDVARRSDDLFGIVGVALDREPAGFDAREIDEVTDSRGEIPRPIACPCGDYFMVRSVVDVTACFSPPPTETVTTAPRTESLVIAASNVARAHCRPVSVSSRTTTPFEEPTNRLPRDAARAVTRPSICVSKRSPIPTNSLREPRVIFTVDAPTARQGRIRDQGGQTASFRWLSTGSSVPEIQHGRRSVAMLGLA